MVIRLRDWRARRHLRWYLNPPAKFDANSILLLLAGLMAVGVLLLALAVGGLSAVLVTAVVMVVFVVVVRTAWRQHRRRVVAKLSVLERTEATGAWWWGLDTAMLRLLVLDTDPIEEPGPPGVYKYPPGLWSTEMKVHRMVLTSGAVLSRRAYPKVIGELLKALEGIGIDGEKLAPILDDARSNTDITVWRERIDVVEDLRWLGKYCVMWRRDGRLGTCIALADTFGAAERLGPGRSGREALAALGEAAASLNAG